MSTVLEIGSLSLLRGRGFGDEEVQKATVAEDSARDTQVQSPFFCRSMEHRGSPKITDKPQSHHLAQEDCVSTLHALNAI